MTEVEIDQIDTRLEALRLKDKYRERSVLNSILKEGIREPLQCVAGSKGHLILLDGFKRLRSSLKLGIGVVPVISLGSDEASAILQLIRASNERNLNILEQSALVDKLNNSHRMGVIEIARQLERSPAWVSVRLGFINEMSSVIREEVFSGRFPPRSYMYTLRQFTRVNKIGKKEIDTFVRSVSGKGLSTRDIETLAYGFFRGGANLKEQITRGNQEWTLKQMRRSVSLGEDNSLSEPERRTIKDLELIQKYMGRVTYGINDSRLKTPSFFTTALLLVEGILGKIEAFTGILKEFYDKRR
ncbi:MAG: ParB N-terminal domain-containing protein [bacterium]